MLGFIVIAVVAIALVLVFVANSRWAANRGWVFNKHNPRPSGSGIPMGLAEIYEPSIEHMIQEQESEAARGDQDESREAPDVG